jgi:hypothetical protein
MKTTYGLIFLFIFSILTSCEDDKPCEGYEPHISSLVIQLELIDNETHENLITNGTYSFENLDIEPQNGSNTDLLNSEGNILLVTFDYNNAEGTYTFKNGETNLFEFNVNIKEVEEECYLYNAIESVSFPGQESSFDSENGIYKIFL